MQITIRSKHLEVTPHAQAQIEQKVSRLERLVSEDAMVDVLVAEVQTRSAQERYKAQLTVNNTPFSVRGASSAATMLTALDQALAKANTQLGKRRSIQATKHRLPESPVKVLALGSDGSGQSVSGANELEDLGLPEDDGDWANILEIRSIAARPMKDREVIAQMESENLPFYPFINEETQSLNVMYRLKEGEGYGLLLPM
jgi:putative sigma-54 modulation protein